MRIKLRNIEFTKAASTAYSSLTEREKATTMKLLEIVSVDSRNELLHHKIYKLASPDKDLYVIRLSLKLRILIELTETDVKVLDIINHDLFIRYFKKIN